MFGGSSSSEDDYSSGSPCFSGFSVGSEGASRSCSSLGDSLHIWLLPGAVLVEALLMKHAPLSLPGREMVAIVPGDFPLL
jgi:hypothetical protein